MDLQTLTTLFSTTYNADPNIRKSAELQIRKIGSQEGVIPALLQIIASDNVDLATRQSCAVYLKNRVQSTYGATAPSSHQPDFILPSDADREALRSSLIPLIAVSPSRTVTTPLASALKSVVAHDFPSRWPSLLPAVKSLLESGDVRQVSAGCVVTLEVVRAFRFRQNSDYLSEIVKELFPTLASIATRMIESLPSNPASQEIPMMLHLILKAYRTSTIVNLSVHQQSGESLVPWGRLFFQVINLTIPSEAVPQDEEERQTCEWWKAKKWAYGTLGRLFHRFGNPSQLPSPMQKEYGAFAQHFVTTFAPEIIKVYLQQVELYISGQAWLSDKCQYLIFQFLTECVKPKSTWVLLKPHFESLISSFVFPQLSFTSTKQQLWEHDPVEYTRNSVDEYENFTTPASAATTFMYALAGSRTKTTFMPILGFINSVLKSNAAPPQRFGALNMIAALGSFVMKHPDVQNNMEQFLMQHVLPEFSAPEPYLNAVASEVLGTMEKAGMRWTNQENLNAHFTAVAAKLDANDLPVRVHSILALTEMITAHDSVKAAVAPQVGKVIQDLLKLSDETDLDILNNSMEVIVEHYQDELLPVAAQLTARLCESYLRLAKEGVSQEESQPTDLESIMTSDDDKVYAAMGVAKTIATIVSSVDSSPEILKQVQEVIIPVIVFTLDNKLLDLFDNMYELVDSLTFKLRSVSPSMWPVFELTYKLFKSDAVDFLDEMLPALDNFVSYGGDVFKARSDYKQMVLDIYMTAMASDQLGDNDRINGCKLAESMMLNLRGHIDELLQHIILTAYDYIGKAETKALRLANLEVLINAIVYNAAAALQLMETARPGSARTFFDKWFAAINSENSLPRVHDKKLSIVAICALLEMDPSAVPESLRDGWPAIVGSALRIFKDLPEAVKARKELESALEGDDDDDDILDDEHLLNMNEEDEDVWDDDSAYLEMLAKEGAIQRERSERLANGEEDEDEDEESDIEEELGFISPLDAVNPYQTFKQALTTFQMKNGSSYQAATTALPVEQQVFLMDVMRMADSQGNGAA